MKTRAELKETAKKGFTASYWQAVAVLFVFSLLACAISIIPIAGPILDILLAIPLSVGVYYYFLLLAQHKNSEFSKPFKVSFSNNYPKYLGGMLWMELFIFLWSLLLIIPGIIKSFSYAMTPYILADCPDIKATQALKISKRMMKGHKFEYFVLGLSFIWWYLLSVILFGIPFIFYVGPYIQTTMCAYYDNLLELSIKDGIVSKDEIGVRASESEMDLI